MLHQECLKSLTPSRPTSFFNVRVSYPHLQMVELRRLDPKVIFCSKNGICTDFSTLPVHCSGIVMGSCVGGYWEILLFEVPLEAVLDS